MWTLPIVNTLLCIYLCYTASLEASLTSNPSQQALEDKLENDIINRSQNIFDRESLEYRLTKLLDIHVGGDQKRPLGGYQQQYEERPDTKINQQKNAHDILPTDFQHALEKINTDISSVKNSLKEIATKASRDLCLEDTLIGTSCFGRIHQLCQQSHTTVLNKPPKHSDNRIVPTSCKEILESGMNISGIYQIQPKKSDKPFLVLCDMEIRGGGWTHIQKRFDGSQDFFLDYRDYKFGFGNLNGEFWLGLESIYKLTGFQATELLIEIVDRDNKTAYAHFTSFAIGSEPEGYNLHTLKGFSGDAGDSLSSHIGSKFSAKDFDQDIHNTINCAENFKGGWWYKGCHESNLNGKYINVVPAAAYNFMGMNWKTYRGHAYCHAKARMMVRPI